MLFEACLTSKRSIARPAQDSNIGSYARRDDRQSEHASLHLCVTPDEQLLLQALQMNCFDIAPVRLAIT